MTMRRPQPARMARAAALTCAAALAVAPLQASASAGRTLSQAVRAVTTDTGLPEQAELHLGRAYDHFNAGDFATAEEELKRAARFAPQWAPMAYNLAVVAEAQGHLDQAIERYEAYRPHASGDTALVVDQRLNALEERKATIQSADRRKLILGGVAMGTSVAALGGGITLFVLRKDAQEESAAIGRQLDETGSDAMRDELAARKADLDRTAKNYYVGAYILTLYGGIAILYSAIYLSRAIRERKAKRLALRPTGSGVALRF
ncbi:MAG: hypothetical protein R3A79_31315 [Nannocystaceae bacterium]